MHPIVQQVGYIEENVYHLKHGSLNSTDFIVCLFGFYGISTFVCYLMPNPFLYK